ASAGMLPPLSSGAARCVHGRVYSSGLHSIVEAFFGALPTSRLSNNVVICSASNASSNSEFSFEIYYQNRLRDSESVTRRPKEIYYKELLLSSSCLRWLVEENLIE
ncbi:hypothetical protein KI387_033978, partial [Taxus chinensis]